MRKKRKKDGGEAWRLICCKRQSLKEIFFSCWIPFLGKMDPNESLATWQSADQLACIQVDRKERVELFVGSSWWERIIFLMKHYPKAGMI